MDNKKIKDIEVEVRGQLTKSEFARLNDFLKKNGTFKQNKDRVVIDYSVFLKEEGLEDRVNDIRLRVTNKVPEIIVKVGKFGGEENRKELSVLAYPGDYDKLVQIFAVLGLTKGMLCVRKSLVYEYKGIEFALVEVPHHSLYFEAEIMVSPGMDKNKAKQFIKNTCEQLGLKLFTDETFFAYIDKLNNEANEVFDYKNYKDGYFQDRFKL